ncbi:HET-domain-containing protein [Hypomontagnella monticulosa]|nr:HET-domain-containing protein [Hypomontagnella monticulosa]
MDRARDIIDSPEFHELVIQPISILSSDPREIPDFIRFNIDGLGCPINSDQLEFHDLLVNEILNPTEWSDLPEFFKRRADGLVEGCNRLLSHLPSQLGELAQIRQSYSDLRDFSQDIQRILRDLCTRDSRFSPISSAIDEFIDGVVGLNERDSALARMERFISFVQPIGVESKLDSRTTLAITMAYYCQFSLAIDNDHIDYFTLNEAIREIIDSAISKLLSVFGLDIMPRQVPIAADPSTHFKLLRDLYEMSKNLVPRSVEIVATESKSTENTEDAYEYSTSLDSTAGEVRVLEILPGTEDDPIKCHLKVCNLNDDDIPEVLSYVWGKIWSDERISVDGKSFRVTKNLFESLRGLRNPDVSRTIWIDAICINQADNEEKTGQVRLMGDIYSKAKQTIIWLGDGKQSYRSTFDYEALYRPLPEGFGGIDIDEFDLAAILKRCQCYPMESRWSEDKAACFVMLHRCIFQITLHEWWERIWTLQEGALPPRAPMIFFRGHYLFFNDFMDALNLLYTYSESEDGDRLAVRLSDASAPEVKQVMSDIGRGEIGTLYNVPLLALLRPGLKLERSPGVKTLTGLLLLTDTYRSSEPRDKVFALASLLPKCISQLLHVDYTKDLMAVFRDATAQSYNSREEFELLEKYPFLFESRLRANEVPTGPSWVLDFTYSDNYYRHSNSITNLTDRLPLDGFLSRNKPPNFDVCDPDADMRFATPRSLFCKGYCVDQLSGIGVIPEVGDSDPEAHICLLVLKANKIRLLALGFAELSASGLEISDISVKVSELIDDIEKRRIPPGDEHISLFNLFSMQMAEDWSTNNLPVTASDEAIKTRNHELAGKNFFITPKGIVGIATAPVEPGDILCWIRKSPRYFILRGTGDQGDILDESQKYRIVARAAIAENLVDMKALIESLPIRSFQIV